MGDLAGQGGEAGRPTACRRCAASPATCSHSTRPPSPAGRRADRRPRARAVPVPRAEIAALMAAADAAARAAGGDLADADRPAGRHRHAGRRGDRARPRRLDPRPGLRWSPRQVRQVPRGAAAPDHGRRARAPTRGCETGSARRRRQRRCSSPARHPTDLANVHLHVPPRWPGGRAHRPLGRCRPRVHDLRHAFAVTTLLDWYRDGVDVQARLPLLSTYLGHVDPRHLLVPAAAPELLALAAQRLDHACGSGRERPGPDPAGVLHRPAAPATPRQPAHRRRLPRHLAAAARPSPRQTGKPPSQLDLADLDAALIGAFLDHLEHQRGQQRAHPQRPPGRDPLAVPLTPRCATPSTPPSIQRVLAIPPSACDRPPSPTSPTTRSTPCSPPPTAPPGPAAATTPCSARRPDRAAGLRTDRPEPQRRPPRHRRPRRCHGKGRKDRTTPLTTPDRQGPAGLAHRTRRTPSRPAVPHPHRRPAQPRRRRAPRRQARRHRRSHLPVAQDQERHRPHAAAHRRHAPPARRRRHLRHRALARPRTSTPPRSTFTPTWPSRNGPRPHHAPDTTPGRYRPPTPCSPSSTASDYADPTTRGRPTNGGATANIGITRPRRNAGFTTC